MKIRAIITILFSALFCSLSLANGLEGVWKVEKSGALTIIEETRNGIKAKLGYDGDWYFYNEIKPGVFVDERGNKYKYLDRGEILWESRDRRNKILLFKFKNNSKSDRRDRNGNRDEWGRNGDHQHDYYYDRSNRINLEGKWRNHRSGLVIEIYQIDRNTFEGYNHFGGLRTIYRRTRRNSNVFKDQYGNKIKITEYGTIIFDSKYKRRNFELEKVRRKKRKRY